MGDAATAARVAVVEVRAAEDGKSPTLERAPVVLVSSAAARACSEVVTDLGRRYRERAWFRLGGTTAGAPGEEDLWPVAVLEPPVGPHLLLQLSGVQHELTVARRAAGRARTEAAELSSRMDLLTETIRGSGALLDPGMVCRFIMARASDVLGSRRWRIYRVEPSTSLLRLEAWFDEDAGAVEPPPTMALDRGLAARVATRREPACWTDGDADPFPDEWSDRIPRNVLALPLVSRGRVIGVAEWGDVADGQFPGEAVASTRSLMDPAALALDNAQLFRKLEERTVTDDLTGLYNGRFMESYMRREVKRASRYGHSVALLFIDLDGFKLVNDVHGHMAGSRTLVEVGDVLRNNVRDVDVVARWGGDEFGIILPETDGQGGEVIARRLCERVRERTFLGSMGLAVNISASIGVAAFPEHCSDAAALLAAADSAMYHVKYHGKDGVCVTPGPLEVARKGS